MHMATEVLPRQPQRRPATQRWALPCRLAGHTWRGNSKSQVTVSTFILKVLYLYSAQACVQCNYCTVWKSLDTDTLTRRLSMSRPLNPGVAGSLPSLLGNSGCQYRWPNFWEDKNKTNKINKTVRPYLFLINIKNLTLKVLLYGLVLGYFVI